MINEMFRVEDKQDIYLNRKPKTQFSLYKQEGNAFVLQGKFTAAGNGASDEKCLRAYLDAEDGEQGQS